MLFHREVAAIMVKGILTAYCVLILLAASMSLLSDPRNQPTKDISAIIVMGLTLWGVWRREPIFLLAMPAWGLFQFALMASGTHNPAAALGQVTGICVPLALAFLNYKAISAKQKKTPKAHDPAT